MSIAAELQKTIDLLKGGAAQNINGLLPDLIKEWNLATGLQMYNLEPIAKEFYPVLSPIRNITPRTGGKGKQAEYKAITAINTGAANGWTAEGAAGTQITHTFANIIAVYRTLALGDGVTFEQQWAGQGYIDSKAKAVATLLRAMMIVEEDACLFGQNTTQATNQQAPGALGTTATPTVATSASGGSIGAGTYLVVTVAHTGMGAAIKSAEVSTGALTGSTNTITVTPARTAGQPILGFDIYVGTVSGTVYKCIAGTHFTKQADSYATNGAAVTLTSVPVSGTQAPTSDATANANAYNGLLAQIAGGSGAAITNVDAALSDTTAIDNHLKSMWDTGRADPDLMFLNSTESVKITNITIGASGTPYFVVVDQQNGATANYRVARFTNKVTGTEVLVKVHPTLKQGNILTLSSRLPGWYVPTDISAPWCLDLVQDYTEIDYPPTRTDPKYNVEVRLYGTLKLYLPVLQGWLRGIKTA